MLTFRPKAHSKVMNLMSDMIEKGPSSLQFATRAYGGMEMTRPWNNLSIIVVDDNHNIQQELQDIYNQLGLNVVATAGNGFEALALLEKNQSDLISLDLIMPEMDGFETFQKVCERYENCRPFIVSWIGDDPRVKQSLEPVVAPDHIIGKPVNFDKMTQFFNRFFAASFPVGGETDISPEFNDEIAIPSRNLSKIA